MRISEFGKQKLKSFFSLFNPQSAIYIPHSIRYLSLGQQRILFVLALVIFGILYFRFYYHPPLPSFIEVAKEFVIEVSGEVLNPGIFIFQNPPTLKEAIEKAGGLKEPAIFEEAASSEILETGTLLIIKKESSQISPYPPLIKGGQGGIRKEEHGGVKVDEIKIKIGRMEARKLLVFSIPLDLNRVSVEDLCLIPGIGESLAQEIVTYRERRRGFRSVEELKNVKGVGEKKYNSFKEFFIIRP